MFLGVPASVRWLVLAVALVEVGVLVRLSVPSPPNLDLGRMFFWATITVFAAAFPVRLSGGVYATTTTAPVLAAVFDTALPSPLAVALVALIGSLELRDLRRELPWWGTVYNRSNYSLAAVAAWLMFDATRGALGAGDPLGTLVQIVLVGGAFAVVNFGLALALASRRTGTPLARVWAASGRNVVTGLGAQVPLGWLMAEIAINVGQWAVLLFMVPLLLARYSFSKYSEVRELFFGSVSALSQAIDAKDGFTRGHADRVSRIAGAMAREMGLSEASIEQIELAGLLHDIGKIGVEDRILMKPAALDPDEIERCGATPSTVRRLSSRRPPCARSCHWCSRITRITTAPDIRKASRASRSRSGRGSSSWPTPMRQ